MENEANDMWVDIWVVDHVTSEVQSWNARPIWQKMHFWAHLIFGNFAKMSTLEKRISSNFDPREVFFDFLESLGCPINKSFGIISIESSMYMYEALWVHILNLGAEDEL